MEDIARTVDGLSIKDSVTEMDDGKTELASAGKSSATGGSSNNENGTVWTAKKQVLSSEPKLVEVLDFIFPFCLCKNGTDSGFALVGKAWAGAWRTFFRQVDVISPVYLNFPQSVRSVDQRLSLVENLVSNLISRDAAEGAAGDSAGHSRVNSMQMRLYLYHVIQQYIAEPKPHNLGAELYALVEPLLKLCLRLAKGAVVRAGDEALAPYLARVHASYIKSAEIVLHGFSHLNLFYCNTRKGLPRLPTISATVFGHYVESFEAATVADVLALVPPTEPTPLPATTLSFVSPEGGVLRLSSESALVSQSVMLSTFLHSLHCPSSAPLSLSFPGQHNIALLAKLEALLETGALDGLQIPKPLPGPLESLLSPTLVEFMESLSQEELFELILVASAHDMKPLLDLGCAAVASMVRGKSPDEIRTQLNLPKPADYIPSEEELRQLHDEIMGDVDEEEDEAMLAAAEAAMQEADAAAAAAAAEEGT